MSRWADASLSLAPAAIPRSCLVYGSSNLDRLIGSKSEPKTIQVLFCPILPDRCHVPSAPLQKRRPRERGDAVIPARVVSFVPVRLPPVSCSLFGAKSAKPCGWRRLVAVTGTRCLALSL
ncbi:hypothetical protein Cni_G11294 [Canna indica]|uniref:Uncharacterized protein n=1 Tax=Canna indica TaxID=4628 RepID=A0AAQ3K612_9LILI|nr:hypothetical protein Cni_G11294 [Canna indica]